MTTLRTPEPDQTPITLEEQQQAIAQRERIAKMYNRPSGKTMQDLADRTTEEGVEFFTKGAGQ